MKRIANAAPNCTKGCALSPLEGEQKINKRELEINSVNLPPRTQQKEFCEAVTENNRQRQKKVKIQQ